MMARLYELRFDRGLTQQSIGELLGIGQPAVSRRESRLKRRFVAAGLPEPIAPGRNLFDVTATSF
jgi:transcriptional regulator with XRE-family HTH domain